MLPVEGLLKRILRPAGLDCKEAENDASGNMPPSDVTQKYYRPLHNRQSASGVQACFSLGGKGAQACGDCEGCWGVVCLFGVAIVTIPVRLNAFNIDQSRSWTYLMGRWQLFPRRTSSRLQSSVVQRRGLWRESSEAATVSKAMISYSLQACSSIESN